jgi:hypothetical protein
MTSHNTFETLFHQRLLDILYGQWSALGAPFVNPRALGHAEVIDPEALLWCSLEFLPTEPRLCEAVTDWIQKNPHYLVRQRIYKIADRKDPRAVIWQALDHRATKKNERAAPVEPPYGVDSPADLLAFAKSIEDRTPDRAEAPSRLASRRTDPATLLLRARDLLGHDIRHFLLVYLLAHQHGGKLRDATAWSGHSYRSFYDAAIRWEAAGLVTIDAGYCRLKVPDLFHALLQLGSEQIILANWQTIFQTSIRLLRDLAKARKKGFAEDSAIVNTLKQEVAVKLDSPNVYTKWVPDASVTYLLLGSTPPAPATASISQTSRR